MGAWTYCKCNAGLSFPSLREALERSRTCPQCKRTLVVSDSDVGPAVDAAMERIDRLEKIVRHLARKGT